MPCMRQCHEKGTPIPHCTDCRYYYPSSTNVLPPSAFSPSNVEYTIKSLNLKKLPGYDLITPKIIKHLPKKALLFLTYIYNSILCSTYFPAVWKFSNIIMIPKPNKLSHVPSSYRPDSLPPVMGKILEKLILRRLLPILDTYKIIRTHQFGFRSQHSSTQQTFPPPYSPSITAQSLARRLLR